jgi:isoleucyl-tRNA synthetase
MRWLYCRHNPASNLNFGPVPANEVRAKFHIKLWNCNSLFVNYARLDGFDAAKPLAASLQDIDRWILSDLQGLIATARKEFEAYNVIAFCLEAERFVDDRLSNWYIRRNRGRFQSNVDSLDDAGRRDKWAAHQTLYTVLTTLCKLFAPVVPFLTEAMWQNLRTEEDQESVHLCDYPEPNPALVDDRLSSDMDALLELVSLGGAVRNVAKTKIRQPLAELRIQTTDDEIRQAVQRFPDQIVEELNVKRVTLHNGAAPLLTASARLNRKTAAAKLKDKARAAEAFLATASATELAERLKTGPVEIEGVPLDSNDLVIEFKAADGWAGVADKDTQVALDTRITEELASEGMARDVIRLVQEHRKNSGLNIEDRIALYLHTDNEKLWAAIEAHRDHIAAETLTVRWATEPVGQVVEVKVEGQVLRLGLRRVE